MSPAGHRLLSPIVAGLLCAVCAIVGLGLLGGSQRRELSLHQLASQGSVSMSCAEESGPADALLWCADPDSPQCLPALPEAPKTDLGQHGPVAVPMPIDGAAHLALGRLMAWPERWASALATVRLSQRLERPPKRA